MHTLLLFSKPTLRKGIGPFLLLNIHHILPAFIILNFLFGCGNGKSGKIRLHARDSADVAISGTWVAADQTRKDMKADSAGLTDPVAGFVLNENHSAVIFSKGKDSVKEIKASWIWNKNKKGTTTSIPDEPSNTKVILILRQAAGDSTILLRLASAEQDGETVLHSSPMCSFKKEK